MGELAWGDWLLCLLGVGLSGNVCMFDAQDKSDMAMRPLTQAQRISSKPTKAVLKNMQQLAYEAKDIDKCFQDNRYFQYCMVFTQEGWKVWDENMQEPYQIYVIDNGPDYSKNGLFRIRQNGKIGYASAKTGQVRIRGQYDCAWPFENGVAFVGVGCEHQSDGEGHGYWVGGQWQKINQQGVVLQKNVSNPFGS